MGRVTFAPRRFMSKFMGSSIRMYGTLFGDQARIDDSERVRGRTK